MLGNGDAARVAPLLSDENLQVRREALLALSRMETSKVGGRALVDAMREMSGVRDAAIPHAFGIAATRYREAFLPALLDSMPAPKVGPSGKPAVVKQRRNLVPNPSFEEGDAAVPKGWAIRDFSGAGKQAIVTPGRTGGRCVKLSASKLSEVGTYLEVDVKPYMNYRLTGWIKTAGVKGSGRGAMFYLPGLVKNCSPTVKGDYAWRRIVHEFDTQDSKRLRIYCLLGGWGQAVGEAWFDDLELIELKPSVGDLLNLTVARVVARNHAVKSDGARLAALMRRLPDVDPKLARHVVEGLSLGWPGKTKIAFSEGDVARWQSMVNALPAGEQSAILKLAWQAGIKGIKGAPGATPVVDPDAEPALEVHLSVIRDQMRYDKQFLSLPPGRRIKLIFTNVGAMPHPAMYSAM